MSRCKSLGLLIALLVLVFTIPSPAAFGAAPCSVPPGAGGVTVKPNILIIFDSSGSMKENAYQEPYDRNKTYQGLFDPAMWYNYIEASDYFDQTGGPGVGGDWSGNFLNWATMTRVDVAKYILSGGSVRTSGGNTYLALNVECSGSDYDNEYNDTISPYQTPYDGDGNMRYEIKDADAGEMCGAMDVYDDGDHWVATYKVRIRLTTGNNPTGLLHDLEGKVRVGLMYFNIDPSNTNIIEGGHISQYVRALNSTHLSDMVDDLDRNMVHPSSWGRYNCSGATCEKSSWTPLAESVYAAVRYFKQESPYYYSWDYTVADASHRWRDPMYNEEVGDKVWCANNYIILLSDGFTTQDLNIPSWLRDYDGDGCDPRPGPGCGYIWDGTGDPCGTFNCSSSCADNDWCDYPDPTSCDEKRHGACGSAYLDDVAYYAHTEDMRSDLANDQTITLHTIFMFGTIGDTDTLLEKAAQKGGGRYYLAEDADTISSALSDVFEEIVDSAASASSVAVTSQATSSSLMIFIPYYKHPAADLWYGNVRAFDLDANGDIIDASSAVATDIDGDGVYDNAVWDGELKVKEKVGNDSRSLFTLISGSKVDFDNSHRSTIGPYFDCDFDGDGTLDENTEVSALIHYIRGDDTPPGGYDFRRRMEHYIGDIIHADPVFSGKPLARFGVIYGDSSYWDFYWANTSRTETLFAPANDGILHAFNASSGEEMWGYIPYNLLPHLQWLTDPSYCHVTYVDLATRVWEVKLGSDWKSLLLGGMRFGGTPIDVDTNDDGVVDTTLRSAYFALDVTDPTNPVVKWEISDNTFGYTTSKPIAVKVGDNWYIVFGSGPKTRDGEGDSTADGYTDTNGYIFVVNASDGSIARTLSLGTRGANNFFGSPVAVDYDVDYSVDVIYIGDAKGNLWRIKTFTGPEDSKTYYTPSGWITDVASDNPDAAEPNPLLSLSPVDGDQPILLKPAVALDASGRLWIYVGTGRFFCGNDNLYCGAGNDCPSSGGCSITEGGQTRSKYMAVGVFDRYWDSGSSAYVMATSTITLSDLDHRIIISGALTGDGGLSGYAIVDDQYPSADISTNICTTCKGWYFHLLENKDRCLGDFLVYSEVVFFLTYKPTGVPNDPCGGVGESNLYGVYYTSGTSTITGLFDLDGDGNIDEGDTVIIGENKAVGGAIVQLSQGFSGGSPIALGDTLYLPLGITVDISPPGELPETGITSWKEVWD